MRKLWTLIFENEALVTTLSEAKVTENGRGEISVRVLHRDEKVVTMRFSVRDTGIGMDEAMAGRVLVVEDDRINQRVIELMLKNLGLQSVIVADGTAAVDVATFEQWDAVLMDCQMAGMDGIEATRQIRGKLNGRVLPIIALAANAMATDRDACMAAGMDDFVAKPVRQHELRSGLERWVTQAAVDPRTNRSAGLIRGRRHQAAAVTSRLFQGAENNRSILPAKSQIVAQHRAHFRGTRDVGHIVQVAIRIRILKIDGGRDRLRLDRLGADD